jgi:hypothetical protein
MSISICDDKSELKATEWHASIVIALTKAEEIVLLSEPQICFSLSLSLPRRELELTTLIDFFPHIQLQISSARS